MLSISSPEKIDALASEIAASGYLSCETAELGGDWFLPLDETTRTKIDASIMRIFVYATREDLRVAPRD